MKLRPIPPQTPALQTPEEADAYYRAVLQELIEQGRTLARLASERAAQQPEADHTNPLNRIARAIHETEALARHIASGTPKARQPAETMPQAGSPLALSPNTIH